MPCVVCLFISGFKDFEFPALAYFIAPFKEVKLGAKIKMRVEIKGFVYDKNDMQK